MKTWQRAVAVGVASVVLVCTTTRFLGETLLQPTFVSGWLTWLPLAVFCGVWWWPPKSLEHLQRRVKWQATLGLPLTAVALLHVGSHLPTGWVDGLLSVLFLAFFLSTLAGVLLAFSNSSDPSAPFGSQATLIAESSFKGLAKWVCAHTAIALSVVGLSLFHGVYVHAHGVMAFIANGLEQ